MVVTTNYSDIVDEKILEGVKKQNARVAEYLEVESKEVKGNERS